MVTSLAARASRTRLQSGKPLRLVARGGRPYPFRRVFGKADDLERARPLFQAADVAALLECRDQAVNARFGTQIERVFHFIERGGDAGFAHPLVNEHEKLILLLRQHVTPWALGIRRTNPKHESFYFGSLPTSTAGTWLAKTSPWL